MQLGLTALAVRPQHPGAVRPRPRRLRLEGNDGNFQVPLIKDNTGTGPDEGEESQPCRKAK